ncbi:hypothetical protein PIB30_006093 [Stylosanthes scabra]|uniref:CCHC-type domain-containing protein n=1 Tax=Stylosanthes scabra TaxID=79078 RepID=A0ABU6V6D1_9FABA|nr:hypothetical protein [Stylosanthes scabra]
MESFGLPCVHILAVLVRLDLGYLPKSLILHRWTKTAKIDTSCATGDDRSNDDAAIYRSKVGALLHHCKRFVKDACMSEEDFKAYSEKIVEETILLETKGTGRGNNLVGTRSVRRRKCSTCGQLGHRRPKCPNGPPPIGPPTQGTCRSGPSQSAPPNNEVVGRALAEEALDPPVSLN